MQFVPRSMNGSDKLCVFMDIGKLKLPIPDVISTPHGQEFLDSDEKKEQYYQDQIFPYLFFNVDTYNTLNNNDPESWAVVFKSVNIFLSTLSDTDCLNMAMAYVAMHRQLKRMTSLNMIQTIDKVGDFISMMDDQIDLCPKLIEFTERHMPLPNLDNAGERPHDTDEMTFRKSHMLELTSIALLCKMLTPIFGQFFWQYKNNINIDNNVKEIHCASTLKRIFEKRHLQLILKFNNFVDTTVLQHYKKKDDVATAYGGNTAESQSLSGSSTIWTRKFITVDLYKQNGNLMTYVTVCLNNSVETQYKAPISRKIKERSVNGIKDITADEGNASRIETESIATSKTADIPVIAKWTAEHIVELYKSALEIPKDTYQEAAAYYRLNLPPMTPLSNYLLCTYFGKTMGGALNISMLQATTYAELSIILQYILIRQGRYGLAHALTLLPTNRKKPTLTDMDHRVRMSWGSSYSFTNLKKRFVVDIGSIQCGVKMKELVEFLTTNIHSFNTAPVFWNLIQDENVNGYQFECTADIMDSLCEFIIYVIDTQYNYKG